MEDYNFTAVIMASVGCSAFLPGSAALFAGRPVKISGWRGTPGVAWQGETPLSSAPLVGCVWYWHSRGHQGTPAHRCCPSPAQTHPGTLLRAPWLWREARSSRAAPLWDPLHPAAPVWPHKQPHSLTHFLSSAPARLSQPVPATTAACDMPGKELGLGMAGCNSDSCDSMVSTASNHSQRVSHPVAPSPGTAHPSQHEIWVSFLLSSISVLLKASPCRCCGSAWGARCQGQHKGPRNSCPKVLGVLRGSDGADLTAARIPWGIKPSCKSCRRGRGGLSWHWAGGAWWFLHAGLHQLENWVRAAPAG